VSVGHVARLLEAAGIATVVIAVAAFHDRLQAMSLPRLVVTPHLMGRPLGMPGDWERQRASLLAAFDLLENAGQGKTVVELARYWATHHRRRPHRAAFRSEASVWTKKRPTR